MQSLSTETSPKSAFRSRTGVATFLIILLLVVGVLWRVNTRNGLLRSAIVLVSKEHWVGPERHNGDIQNYDWLTDTDVMLYRKNSDNTVSMLRKLVVPNGEASAAVEMPLLKVVNPVGITMSTDRETLRVLYERRSAPRKHRMTSELISIRDGKRYGPVSGWKLGTYYASQRAECECEIDNKKLMASLSTFDSVKPREIEIKGIKDPGAVDGLVWPLFVAPDGHVIAELDSYYSGIVTPADAASLGSKLSPVISFLEFNINHPEQPGKTWSVPVPKDAATFNCGLSPQHNRLLWTVQSNNMPVLTRLSQHLPKAMRLHPKYLARWMVSDLYGNNMRTIAEYEISDLHFNRPDLVTPRWMPDGKHISFEYRSALYMIAVD